MAIDLDRGVYLDHAATTPVDRRVVEAMLPFWTERYGNPSSIYRLGRDAAKALNGARERIAGILQADPSEIIFTSCGTESDNLAIRGVAFAQRARGKGSHIITSSVEHHAVGHTVEQLVKKFGFEATFLPVDHYGMVDPDEVARAIRPDTVLITIMYANNEVGTIQPIAEIGRLARERGIPFHTDAVQAGGALPLDVNALNVDLLSLSAHKFYGPKGVGLLYVRKGTPLWPMQTGGSQERNRRAGTENVAFAVGMATALELAYAELEQTNRRVQALRDRLIAGVLERIPDVELTGHPTQRLPNSASFVVKYVEGEAMLLNLDMKGIFASSGSACTSMSLSPSHVLTAMGFPPEIAHGSLRMTLGKGNTEEEIDYVLDVLPEIVSRLRAMSPLYQPAA
ncbi:MAG: cysteine desulfurase NifS [Anaerolineae bacterium]|nr:cysteine desulfurase NifS [Anaerolineae bacterium]